MLQKKITLTCLCLLRRVCFTETEAVKTICYIIVKKKSFVTEKDFCFLNTLKGN